MTDFVVAAPALTSLAVAGDVRRFPVRRIYCVGRNYVEHIREMKESDERDPPFFFQKPRDAIVENGATVPYPPLTADFQYEAELVVAIARPGVSIDPEQALSHVFGYAVGLDMTRRDRQKECITRGIPWEVGKAFDHSAPCGSIHPASQCGHISKGRIHLAVNGQMRQDSDVSLLIWQVPEIIANLSRQVSLYPGDLIYTGTPAGVSAVGPGDTLTAGVDGLSELTITIGQAS